MNSQISISLSIVIALVLRCIEVVSTIVPWNNTDHLFRLLAVLFDIVTSVLIITVSILDLLIMNL